MRFFSLLLIVSLQACSSTPPTTHKAPSTTQALDLSKGETSSVLKALSRSHEEATSLFGAHQLTISVESKLSKEKEQVVLLQESFSLTADNEAQVYIQSTNNQNTGFDAYQSKATNALALRYGPLHETSRETILRARDTAYTSVYANLELLAPWLSYEPNGSRDINGVSGLAFTIKQRESASVSAPLLPEKSWRATISPVSLAGELVVDPASGFLLFADLQLQYSAVRDEQKVLFEITVKANLTAHKEAVAAIKIPEMEELAPRLRMEKERLDLIGKAALQQQKEKKKKAPKPAWSRPASQPTSAKMRPPPSSAPTP
jgi:hypothetical protein